MADNVTLPGTGDVVAADDDGTSKHQLVKVEYGANGSFTPVDYTNPLPVRPLTDQVKYGPTAVPGTAAAAYIAGDQFGTLISLTNAARATGGSGRITGISFTDGDDLITALDIFFFDDSPTLAADNAPFSISDADADKIIWVARLSFFDDLALNKVNTQYMGISIPYDLVGTTLYAAVRIQTAYTLVATTSPKYKIYVERD